MATYTHISKAARNAAFTCAHGCYQAELLRGTEAWSGATLTGKAASYGDRYATSREALVCRLARHPLLAVAERRVEHGRRVVAICTRAERDSAGGTWEYFEGSWARIRAERQAAEEARLEAEAEANRLAFLARLEEARLDRIAFSML